MAAIKESVIRVKLLVDHVGREIGFASELKALLATRGVIVDVEHQDYQIASKKYDFFKKIFGRKYDVLVTPNYNTARTPDILLRAVLGRSKLIIYHSEQLIKEYIENEKLNLLDTIRFNNHVSAHFVWGKNFSEKLSLKAKVDKGKIFVVGNYKFELGYNSVCDRPPLQPDGVTRILIVSDYKPADYTEEYLLQFKKTYKVQFDKERVAICARAKREMLAFVKDNFVNNDKFLVVIRPHPGERQAAYVEFCDRYSNTQIADISQPISQNIQECDIGLGFTSSSCLEFQAAGIPFISVDFFNFDLGKLGPHQRFLDWKSPSEALELVRTAGLERPKIEFKSKEVFDEYFDLPESPINMCVASILKVAQDSDFTRPKLDLADIRALVTRLIVGSIKALAINVINQSPFSKLFISLNNKIEISESNKISKKEVLHRDYCTSVEGSYDEILLTLSSYGWKDER